MPTLNRVSRLIHTVAELTAARVAMRNEIVKSVHKPGVHARLPRDYCRLEGLFYMEAKRRNEWIALTDDAASMKERVKGSNRIHRIVIAPDLVRALKARGVEVEG